MNNPVEVLKQEHRVLLRAIDLAGKLQEEKDDEHYHRLMRDVILFLRNFTELFHFPKEEQVLYPALRNRTENMSPAFIHEICDNHEDFRGLMAELESHYLDRDFRLMRKTAAIYLGALASHIHREEEIILNIAPLLLTSNETAQLSSKFLVMDDRCLGKSEMEKDLDKLSAALKGN
jgi:hemerythrin-like domain-containing protein